MKSPLRSSALHISALLLASTPAFATSLNIGADYQLRGVSIDERDKNVRGSDYYDQRIQAYMTTDLSKDVEATVRVQSITPWGLEGSSTSLNSRYPDDTGGVWLQNAYIRMPGIWRDRIAVTVGRQPLRWGDGQILSDDELGFNAIRATLKSPFQWLEADLDVFTAKINESLRGPGDTDLHGVQIGYSRDLVRWEVMGLVEKSDNSDNYMVGSATIAATASKIDRRIFGVRGIANLRDAYLKAAYYMQNGDVTLAPASPNIKLGGNAYMIGLGGKQDTRKIGRFGAVLEYAVGSGDKASTPTKDEAFRPTFASRWSGLERSGYGRYFAATFSDAYSPSNPFGNASGTNDGLPGGVSGIQTIRFGVELTPWAQWTFSVDYYQYKAQNRNSDIVSAGTATSKELGTEMDYGLAYRYSGLLTVRVLTAIFSTGDAYEEVSRRNGSRTDAEIELHF